MGDQETTRPTADDLRARIRDMDPALEENSDEFDEALVRLAALYLGTGHGAGRRLAEFTGVAYGRTLRFLRRRASGIWSDGRTVAEKTMLRKARLHQDNQLAKSKQTPGDLSNAECIAVRRLGQLICYESRLYRYFQDDRRNWRRVAKVYPLRRTLRDRGRDITNWNLGNERALALGYVLTPVDISEAEARLAQAAQTAEQGGAWTRTPSTRR